MSSTPLVASTAARAKPRRVAAFAPFVRSARICLALACSIALAGSRGNAAVSKMKLSGYLTARADANTVMILDDRLELTAASKIIGKDDSGEHPLELADLAPGMLIEAEGQWVDRHRFFPERLPV